MIEHTSVGAHLEMDSYHRFVAADNLRHHGSPTVVCLCLVDRADVVAVGISIAVDMLAVKPVTRSGLHSLEHLVVIGPMLTLASSFGQRRSLLVS